MAEQCVDNGNGTVTDKGSGLMWQKETAGPMSWEAAMGYAAGLNLGGKTGWRLPTADELQGLFVSSCKSRMSAVSYSSNYWSSTTIANYTSYAWRVSFHDGFVHGDYKSRSYLVRAVRAAQ